MSEPKALYTARFERLEGSRPPVQDDWGWESNEAEDIGASPLDLSNYKGDEVDELRGQIRLLTAALDAATSHQDGQGDVKPAELLLEDVRAAFRKAYVNIPPILSMNWGFDVVAALLGVTR